MPLGGVHSGEVVTVYYPDLSPYTYSRPSRLMVNVGWLAIGHAIPQGSIDVGIRDQLVRLAREPENLMRGFHYCEFCDAESPLIATTPDEPEKPAYLGSGEIHVDAGSVVYAAPTLVVHYIDAHAYLPPPEFCDAVRIRVG